MLKESVLPASLPGPQISRTVTISSYNSLGVPSGWSGPGIPPASSSVSCNASSGAALLEETFAIVSDDVASGHAAAAEALALARAAAEAARQAAALADPSNLSVLGELDLKARREWGFPALPRETGAAVPRPAGVCALTQERHQALGLQPTVQDLLWEYIADKQKLSSAFLSPGRVEQAKRSEQGLRESKARKQVAVAPTLATRIVVSSGKKGKRSAKPRRSTKSPELKSELSALKSIPAPAPGSLRDLMDAAPGTNGLLTSAEEVRLINGVQVLMDLERQEQALREQLGRDPTREEWAASAGLPAQQLERRLSQGRRDRQRMIACNMGLVIDIARKYSAWGLSLEEMLTRGASGLVKAMEKFDAGKGFKFSTYAHWWIRQAVGRCVSEQSRTVKIPRHMYELLARISKARDMLVRELGRLPADDEVAELVGISAPRLRKLLKMSRPMVSMDKPTSLDSEQNLGQFLASPVDESEEVDLERKLLNKDLQNALHTLPPREREVLRMRFGLADGRMRTLEEVGSRLNVTRERIRQLEHRALRKLRDPERCSVLVEYVE